MDLPEPRAWDAPSAWRGDSLVDYSPVGAHLPVLEEDITQMEAGTFPIDAEIVSGGGAALLGLRVQPRSVGVSVLDPEYTAFILPVSWSDDLRVNGEKVRSSTLYMPGRQDGYYLRGGQRHLLAAALRRDRFVDVVAALRGVDPEEVTLNAGSLELPRAATARLRAEIGALLRVGSASTPRNGRSMGSAEFAERVFGAVADAYLQACSPASAENGACRRAPERIVRAAEECFVASRARPVSLADLCAAARVGKSALYGAFQQVCGEPPLRYFRRRQLTRARTRLLCSEPEWGGVKRAALGAGFTELGRFSVEYRRLFGESPSVTLARSR